MCYDDDPDALVSRLLDYYRAAHYRRPSTLHDLGGMRAKRPAGVSSTGPAGRHTSIKLVGVYGVIGTTAPSGVNELIDT